MELVGSSGGSTGGEFLFEAIKAAHNVAHAQAQHVGNLLAGRFFEHER